MAQAPAYSIKLPPARTTDPKQLRVAVWSDDELCPVDTEIKAAIEAAATCLESLGAQVNYTARPQFDVAKYIRNYRFMLGSAMGGAMPEEVFDMMTETAQSLAKDDISDTAIMARAIAGPHRGWSRAFERREQFRARWAEFFLEFDVLLCPSAFVTAFPHDHSADINARTLECNGTTRPYFDLLFYAGLTLNGFLPATNVPTGISKEGLPIGMQIAGGYLQDRTTLAVAKILEQKFRPFEAPPGFVDIGGGALYNS